MHHPYLALFIASLLSFGLGIAFSKRFLAEAHELGSSLEYKAEQSAQKLEQDLRRKL